MKSRTAIGLGKTKAVTLRITGYIVGLSGICQYIIGIVNSGSGDRTPGILGTFLLLLAAFCLYCYRRSTRLMADFRKYNAILASDPVKTIYRIAEITNSTPEAVRQNVRRMIDKCYFVNAYIDQSGKIVLADREKMNDVVANNDDRKDFITIICPSCGGVNRLAKEQIGKCEFCGAYISDKV